MEILEEDMHTKIRDSLDNVVSARSSPTSRTQAFNDLERIFARLLVPDADASYIDLLRFLQDTFECNIPSRLMDWISTASLRLDHLLNRGISDCDKGSESATLSTQLVQALSLIQGVALLHHRSKSFLGRKHALEVLVDLLWVSRHCGGSETPQGSPASNVMAISSGKPKSTPINLASTVLDTLLCVLVDSSPALRVFENVNGVQAVVKLLKRPKALRDVKMKCLEFLYFYLLDEATQSDAITPSTTSRPLIPSVSLDSHSQASDRRRVIRDASWGSDDSQSSCSSRSSSSSAKSSSSSATSMSSGSINLTPQASPKPFVGTPRRSSARPRSLLLLQKDVDFVPISPKKLHITRLGITPTRGGTPLRSSQMASPYTTPRRSSEDTYERPGDANADGTRTMAQKKEYLGTMLGNVDALVAGVRNAGMAFA